MFRHASPRRAILLLGATVFVATCLLAHPATGWNSNSRLDLVFSAVDRGTLSIDAYQATEPYATGDKAYYGGHYYSDKVFGVSVVALPMYAVISDVARLTHWHPSFQFIQYVLTRWAVALPAAVAVMLLALLLVRLGAIPRLAILATAGTYFGSMMFGYSTVFFPYLPGIAACLGALTLLLAPPPFRIRRAAAIGGLLGAALVFDLTFIISVAIIGVFLLAACWKAGRVRGLQLLAVAGGAAAVPLGAFIVYSIAIFGSPSIPYQYESSQFFREGMSKGVMGVTSPKLDAAWFLSFDAYRGIFFWSPWVILLVVCAVWLIRTDASLRTIAIASLAAFVGYFLFNAGYYQWWGGATMGPRLMLPMYAVAPLALVAVCRADTPRPLRVATFTTMAAGVALSLPVAMVDPQTLQANLTETLLHVRAGDRLRVLQLEVLQDFYRLRWQGIKPTWLIPIPLSFFGCMIVIGAGVTGAYRVAQRAEPAADPADLADELV